MGIAAQSYLAALIAEAKVTEYLQQGPIGHLFRTDLDQKMHGFVEKFVHDFGKLPSPETFAGHTGVEPIKPKEPSAYYLEVLRQGYTDFSLREMAKKAELHLSGIDKNPAKALEIFQQGVAEIQAKALSQTVHDYRLAGPALMTAHAASWLQGSDYGLKFGWPTLDKMAGGIETGDMVSLAGRPASGKTWLLLWMAISMWRQGRVPLFVSMEIKPLPIFQRLSGIHTKKSVTEIKTGTLSSFASKQWKDVCKSLPELPLPFWVVDGNLTANVRDIHALALQLKPDAIFIDGAYLLSHPTERNRFIRVAENATLIKQQLCDLAPTVCSWQFSRDAKKLKKGEEPGLETIAYSDAIGQLSSLVLGLMEDESIETEKRRKLSVLKGRNGESADFFVKWEFQSTTDFSETEPEKLEELQF